MSTIGGDFVQTEAFSALIQKLDDTGWAAFGGNRTTGCRKLGKAIRDLAAWPSAKNLVYAQKGLGAKPDSLDAAKKKTLEAAAFLRAVHRKCGLPAPYPEDWAGLEKRLYDERQRALEK